MEHNISYKRAIEVLESLYVFYDDYLKSAAHEEVKEAIFLASDVLHQAMWAEHDTKSNITSSTNINANSNIKRIPCSNGKELILIDWHENNHTLALYKEEYAYGGGIALFLCDLTTGEDWGDLTINLPGYSGVSFLQDFISSETVDQLSDVIEVVGEVQYNFGTYRMIEINPSIVDKIPTWDELCDMADPEEYYKGEDL